MGDIFQLRVYYHSAGSQAQKIMYNTKPQILFSKILLLVFITNNKIPKKMWGCVAPLSKPLFYSQIYWHIEMEPNQNEDIFINHY